MEIYTTGGTMSTQEKTAYVKYIEDKYGRKLKKLDIYMDGDFVDLNFEFENPPFERIRRITG